MKPRYVVDTNVLVAASAADPVHPHDVDATPEDPLLRMQIWQWLDEFQRSQSRLILDMQGEIFNEYQQKLGFNDFGIQVIMHKWSTAAVDTVSVDYDADGAGILPPALAAVVHDMADRKMVAAALAALEGFGQTCVAFAGDTDWHDWEQVLHKYQIELEPLIEAWSRQKHAHKLRRSLSRSS